MGSCPDDQIPMTKNEFQTTGLLRTALRNGMRFVVVCVTFCWASETPGAIVQFRRSAEVDSSVIRLADVANVRDSDTQNEEQLGGIVLGPAPAPGRQTTLEFVSIRSRLQARGVDLASTEFSGASTILVTRREAPAFVDTTPSDSEAARAQALIRDVVVAHLRAQSPASAQSSVSVQLDTAAVASVLEAAPASFRIVGKTPPLDSPQTMVAQFQSRSGQSGQVRFLCQLSQRPTVVTVKYAVPRGHVLRADDLSYQYADNSETAFASFEEVVGMEALRSLRQGDAILADDVRAVPLVRSSDIVTVYSHAPGISVKRLFKSRGEGTRGDTIMLISLDGQERIAARVTGYHEAEVLGSETPQTTFSDRTGSIRFRDPRRSPLEEGQARRRITKSP